MNAANYPPPDFRGRGTSEACGGASSARQLRKTMTPPERRLWNVLKGRPGGFKFRRQHPFGPFTLDFFCNEAAVAVEVDGLAHELGSNPGRDQRRDSWVREQGVRTLRFRALVIRDNLEGVVAAIVEVCASRSPQRNPTTAPRSPSPANAGEAREAS